MQELMNYAAAGRLREQSVDAGRPLELFLNTPAHGVRAVVHTPDGREEKPVVTDYEDGSRLRFADTDISGIYRVVVTSGGASTEHLFAVNVPARNDDRLSTECDLKRTTQEELSKTYPALDYLQVVRDPARRVPRPADGSAVEVVLYQPLGTTIAHWLLLIVLGLALAEVILAWLFAHHTAAAAEEEPTVRKRTALDTVLRIVPWVLFTLLIGVSVILIHDARTTDFLGFLPEGMRRSAERALDVPAPAAGEKPMWRLEYTSYFWDEKLDPWLPGLVGLAALAMIVFVYRHERGRASRRDRFLLGGLRLGLLALLLGVLLPQLRLWFDRQGWPNVVVLIDDSFSMSAKERYGDPRDREAADKLAQEAKRMALAKAELAGKKDDEAKDKDEAAKLADDSAEKARLLADAAALREQAKNLRQEAELLQTPLVKATTSSACNWSALS